MSFLALNLLFAGVPSLAALYLLRRRESSLGGGPPGLVFPAFFLGFIAVLPAAVVELGLRAMGGFSGGVAGDLLRAFLSAALVEEAMKLLAVRVFLYHRREFRRITDGIRATMAAGFGFAFFENIFYTFEDPLTLILRGLTSVPMHAVASGILGYHVGLSRFTYRPSYGRGILAAVLFHGLYDFFLFRGSGTAFLALPTLGAAAMVLRNLHRRAVLQDEREGRSRLPAGEGGIRRFGASAS